MPSRARNQAPSEEGGFIIIEVLVSALILAIVAGAVLTLITATTRGAAKQRDRSVAYDLAQSDQARLRTIPISEISGTEEKEGQFEKNGTVYTVVSKRKYVNNTLSAASCTGEHTSQDYVTLTTTVSAATMLRPVVLQSAVSPSTGSLNGLNGNLDISTANALGEPLSGVSVAVGTRTASTGSEGCANFVSVPAKTYEVVYRGNGLISEEGAENVTKLLTVKGGETFAAPTIKWDRPATLEPEFVYSEPGTGTLRPAPVDSMSVANATSGQPTAIIGTPAVTTRKAIQVDKAVFPFKAPSEYTVFAGSCTSNNPGTAGGNAVGLYSAVVPPAAYVKPQIRVPALELTVTNATGAIAAGAKVTVTDANSGCKFSGASIKRIFTANAGGHLASGAAGPTEAGLPYGIYNICASLKVGTEFQSVPAKEVKVQSFTTGTTLALKLEKGKTECP